MRLSYFPEKQSFKYAPLFVARLGKAPEGLCRMLRGTERKPGESAAQMWHRIYSRIYGIMWVSKCFFLLRILININFVPFTIKVFSLKLSWCVCVMKPIGFKNVITILIRASPRFSNFILKCYFPIALLQHAFKIGKEPVKGYQLTYVQRKFCVACIITHDFASFLHVVNNS